MKNRILSIAVFTLTVLLAACSKDKGNYDYHDIDDVTIDGIKTDAKYNVSILADTLKIEPKLTSRFNDINDTDYDFEWKIMPIQWSPGDDFKPEDFIISKDKNLVWPVVLDKSGDYCGIFSIIDKKSGVVWSQDFYVSAQYATSEGYMVLCESGTKSRLDLVRPISVDSVLCLRNVWGDSDFDMGRPICIGYSYSVSMSTRLVTTTNGTYNLENQSLGIGEDRDFKYSFGIMPEHLHILNGGMHDRTDNGRWYAITDDGNIYERTVDVGAVYTFPINKINGTTDFKAAPYCCVSNYHRAGGQYPKSAVFYDADHKQFLEVKNGETFPSVMQFVGLSLFPANTGFDMMWMDITREGKMVAVLNDPATNKKYLCCVDLQSENKNKQEYYTEITGPNIEDATMFTALSLMPYVFYSDGTDVYQFDYSTGGTAKKALTLAGEDVKALKVCVTVGFNVYQPWERNRCWQLIVISNDKAKSESDCGILRTYDVPTLMKDLVPVIEQKSLGKVVDVAYREKDHN